MKNPAVALLIIAILKAGTLYADERLSSIEVPPGFSIEIYAEGVENARQMVRGDLGTIFVGSRQVGKVRCEANGFGSNVDIANDAHT